MLQEEMSPERPGNVFSPDGMTCWNGKHFTQNPHERLLLETCL